MKLKDLYFSKNIIKRVKTSFSNKSALVAPNDAVNLQETIQEAIDDGSLVISGGGSGSTNLSVGTTTGTTMVIVSSSGTDATVPSATTSTAGLLSATDKVKLDSLANYTHPNHTGDVVSVNDGATTIQTNVVTNTKLADMVANSVKVRAANTTGDPSDLQLSTNQLLGRGTGDIVPITLGTNLSITGTTLNATGSGGYSTIQDEGTSLTSRSTLDFVGDGITVTDNGTKTVATVATRVANAVNGLSTETNAGLLTTVLGGALDRNTTITGSNTRSLSATDLSSFTLEAESLTPGQRLYRILANSVSSAATFLGQIVGGTDSSTLSISPNGTSSLSRLFTGGSSSVNVSNTGAYLSFNDGTNHSISAQGDGVNFQGVATGTSSNILYYNNSTGAVTYGVAPSGGAATITTANGLSGNGSVGTPAKLGGVLTENTSVDGDNSFSLNLSGLTNGNITADNGIVGTSVITRLGTSATSLNAGFLSSEVNGTSTNFSEVRVNPTNALTRIIRTNGSQQSGAIFASETNAELSTTNGTVKRSYTVDQTTGHKMENVLTGTQDQILYINSTTGAITREAAPSGGSSQLRTTAGSASIIYEVLTGSPVISYSKSAGTGTMSVTGGTIRLRRFSDDILDAERDGTNNFKWVLVGTGTDIKLARPTSSKYTLNAFDNAADASTNATVANQIDQDNTPPVLYGNFVLTGQGGVTIRSNNIPTSGSGAGNGYDFIW